MPPRRLAVFAILALTQITGWGVVGVLPVMAPAIAADLGAALPTAFLGTTVMYVVMGLAAPAVGRALGRVGARRIMAAGAALIGCGSAGMGAAQSVPAYLAAWGLTGLAGAMFLTTAAYVYLADLDEGRARGAIGTLMLVTGLAGSVFWPVTAFLQHLLGWRGTALAYAALMLAVIAPLVLLGLPEAGGARPAAAGPPAATRRGRVFWVLVAAIALNGFVTFGMEATGIALFGALGADPAWAIGLASLLGVLKVCGRLIDLLGGGRWDALATGIAAGAMIPAGLAVLLVFGPAPWAMAACLLAFGIGSGAFAVARATMPLVFFRKADYAAAMSAIALPMNLTNALAAPVLSLLLTRAGADSTLALLVASGGAAFLLLLFLGGQRPQPTPGSDRSAGSAISA